MNKTSEKFLQQLLEAPSPSGFEQPAAKVFRDYVKKDVDQLITDAHGNTITVLNPKAKFKFMLAGHIDEIGLMVTHIDKDGYIYTAQVGGMDPALLIGQRVKILTEKGNVFGVIGRKAIHHMTPDERGKGVKMDNIWVDIGADSKEDAQKRVEIGDPMVIDVPYRRMTDDKIVSRAMDDKAGAFIVAEVMRRLAKKKKDLKISVIGVATVQEELGLRGAITSSYSVNPDAGIAIDVGFASDHPDTDKKKLGDLKLGEGPNLHRGANINPVLEKALLKTAKKHKIPYQITAEARATGTDANAIQLCRGGAAATLISIPNRYMHTPVEMISISDMDNIIKLIVAYITEHPANRDYRI
ncbi:Putative aminopeptidase YsdC [Anaerohalosphaera lusitana]|uniref:Putative aminopeptidase YsdC n=1 Tax=Anaerohalosphaera lusitana TaxID=1936003 RepID=A0A1U9NQ64_9BACT|nr:M42 family metallopeptidase [Anaerohalosphaera lusitana]AQT69656.1 Putative aminopeptidase YsdC [Anaerohalosphaera lusitana]